MSTKIAIIGLGYVGLPLAVAFSEKYKVIGFDINQKRVDELNSGKDETLEIHDDLLKKVLKAKPPLYFSPPMARKSPMAAMP